MLGDEEKKAIEGLFHLAHINTYLDLEKEDVVKISRVIIKKWKDETKIVLNLIEKQSKEIEELKDKIKAKIEVLNKEMLNEENSLELFFRKKYCKDVLQSLLEKE